MNTLHLISIRMHDVTLTLESDHEPLIAYANEHLQGLITEPAPSPDLLTRCFWREGEWQPMVNPFSTQGHLDVIGKRMLGNHDELIWLNTLRMPGLQLRFKRRDKQMVFEVAYHFHLKPEKLARSPEYRSKRYFSLMSYLVYYPLIWHFEAQRNWTVLHASALATEYGGVLIGGLGGVGKTTSCVALMQRPGVQLISENLVFTDGLSAFPCYEPIRLDDNSLRLVGQAPAGLKPMHFPAGLKKKQLFHLDAHALPQIVEPRLMVLPKFTERRYLTKLASGPALEKLLAMNRLTRELDDYAWYAAALDLHWPQPGLNQARVAAIEKFVQHVRCVELGIDRSLGVDAVVEDILASLQNDVGGSSIERIEK